MIKTKKQMFIVIGAFALILLLGTASYAFFNYTRTGETNTVGIGRIYFNTDQGNDTLTLSNIFPMTSSQATTANLDSVAVHIQGDTTYNDGEEFEITLVNVTNTVNGKTIPINYTATYVATTNKEIGTESSSYSAYFTDRGSSSSKYTLEETGEVSEGKQVLVGYIPKNGEVDGTLTIKAYIDSSKVVISDTLENGAIEVTGYNNGYPQPAGAVVLTTAEWNALEGAGTIKFSVRGIANEGTWVEEAGASQTPGTIASCPGCKFVYPTDMYNYGGANNADATLVANMTDTPTTDYRNLNVTAFIGFTETQDGKIDRAFACGIKGENPNQGTPFCIEAALSDAKGGNSTTRATIYANNQSVLNDLTTGIWQGGCTSNVSSISCSGLKSAEARADGEVYVGVIDSGNGGTYDEDSYYCGIRDSGYFACDY